MKPVPAHVRLTTPYGACCCDADTQRHLWSGHVHKGADYGAAVGTEVYAMWDGVITAANWGPAFGKHLVIDHDRLPDNKPGLWVGYMHLSQTMVKPRQRVRAGQLIGKAGRTGNVTGAHLHVEVQQGISWSPSRHVNPKPWIDAVKVVEDEVVGNARLWQKFSGKPSGVVVVGESWTKMDMVLPAAPFSGSEDHFMYARCNFIWTPGATGDAKVECRYVRSDGDETAMDERHYEYGTKSVPFQQLHWEDGEKGVGGTWWMKVHGGCAKMNVTTRYSKVRVLAVEP